MKIRLLALALLALAGTARVEAFDESHHGHESRWRAQLRPWHGSFYHMQYGAPVALVVPPTAPFSADYNWGVCGTEVTRNDHQFQRPYPGPYPPGMNGYYPTPNWPSSTRQFGVYPVRGPW